MRGAESPGPVIGPLLERIAFETQADLDQLQRLLLQLWGALHARGGPAAGTAPAARAPLGAPAAPAAPVESPPAAGLGRTLADRIERGLAAREGVEDIFADVERILGEKIEPEPAGEGPAEFEDGDLEGLVAEFLWETKTEHEPEARVLAALVRQQREAPLPKSDVESLDGGDLLRLLVDAYLRAAPQQRAADVHAAFAVLERFFGWLVATQELEPGNALVVAKTVFVAHVERVAAASSALSGAEPAPLGRAGELWQVAAGGASEVELVSVDAGRRALLDLPAKRPCDLRVGDLLLGTLRVPERDHAAFVGIVVVLPPGVEPILG